MKIIPRLLVAAIAMGGFAGFSTNGFSAGQNPWVPQPVKNFCGKFAIATYGSIYSDNKSTGPELIVNGTRYEIEASDLILSKLKDGQHYCVSGVTSIYKDDGLIYHRVKVEQIESGERAGIEEPAEPEAAPGEYSAA